MSDMDGDEEREGPCFGGYVGKLIQSSMLGCSALSECVATMAEEGVVVAHRFGLWIRICDERYRYAAINSMKKLWIKGNYRPITGDIAIFGMCTRWKMRSRLPYRQIVFFMTSDWDVFAYDSDLIFYQAPSMRDFWGSPVMMEYDNVAMPVSICDRVRLNAVTVEDMIRVYRRFRLEMAVMEGRTDKSIQNGSVPVFEKGPRSREQQILIAATRAARDGNLTPVFIDDDAIRLNCDVPFYEHFIAPWIRKRNCSGSVAPETNVVRRMIALKSRPLPYPSEFFYDPFKISVGSRDASYSTRGDDVQKYVDG